MSKSRATWRRVVAWGLALAALAFVVYVVPIRDRCVDPAAPSAGARVPLSREGNQCVLHRSSGPAVLPHEVCSKLACEPGLASTLGRARLDLVAALGLLYLAGTLAWAIRWHALLRLADVRVSLWHTWRVTLEAQAGGILLPGGVAGDALRVASVVAKGATPATVIGSVLLDRAIGLSTLAGLAAALAAAFDPSGGGAAVLTLAAIPVVFVLGILLLRVPAFARAEWLEHRLLVRTVKPILAYLNDRRAPRAIASGLVASLVLSAVQLGVIRGLCTALREEPIAPRWVYTGSAITFILGIVPAVPGGWGTSDAAFVLFLGRAGLGASTAFAVGLLYRVYWYLAAALGAGLYVSRRGTGDRPAPSA